ncbi:hypothetical protein MPTK1_7g06680 [Marchantia polymorpha subsp. ruderalis]|uniref:Bifunctional inhibitor/plant lipid transfer protein/seed storage helical domain-containing protein n=2 Tax=Marchantia polymorpha TaxID=3197 RepID=A0AAF6BWU8_MARPO|nr:hypothetical protein MARPO_0314s0003 [Marchantia polymorpha]BBN16482.1 hypothetical protein Mp_7g06680 [Marchantia polymorpha subsp. ruderalis]|eukprot:PTQ26849.1 hypothetical protein MARPO_0314s0003 [Marchantia polymorpha]
MSDSSHFLTMEKLGPVSVALFSVLFLLLSSAVSADCDETRDCDENYIKEVLLFGMCLNKPDPNPNNPDPCPPDSCCYNLGTLSTFLDRCICQVIRENDIDSEFFMNQFRACGGRQLKC